MVHVCALASVPHMNAVNKRTLFKFLFTLTGQGLAVKNDTFF